MGSVADRLRDADRQALRALGPGDRVALALALGARDAEIYRRAAHPPLDVEAARRALERQRQAGRRASRCHQALSA